MIYHDNHCFVASLKGRVYMAASKLPAKMPCLTNITSLGLHG